MVPYSLILLVLLAASGFGYMNYFLYLPKRPIMNRKFLMMGGAAALMLFTVILAILDVRVVWLSWVLLAMAIFWLVAVIPQFRASLAANRAREREMNERRARGH